MITIESDNPAIEKALRRLEGQVLAAGGQISENAGVRAQNGQMSLFSTAPQQTGEQLFFLPESCLLALENVHFELSGDKIVMASRDPDVTPEKALMFESLLEIYNLAGKMPFYQATSPWVVFAKDAASLALFTKARPTAAFARELERKDVLDDPDRVLVESYLTTRYLNFEGDGRVLIPFCELGNHHINASSLATVSDKKSGKAISLFTSCPVPGSDECFYQYDLYDPLDLFILYSYVDPQAYFIRSVPVTINLAGLGTLKIKANYVDQKDGKLPAKFADLRLYLPQAAASANKETIQISHLFISGPSSPDATRRILANLIMLFDPSIGDEVLNKFVERAEATILNVNLEFFTEFKKHFLQKSKGNPNNICARMAVEVADTSLAFLNNYCPSG